MTDDEKFIWKDLTVEESKRMTKENIKVSIHLSKSVHIPNLMLFEKYEHLYY